MTYYQLHCIQHRELLFLLFFPLYLGILLKGEVLVFSVALGAVTPRLVSFELIHW